MDQKISNREMRRIIKEIVASVSEETGVRINAYPVTVSEYCNLFLRNNNYSLMKKINGATAAFSKTLAYNDMSGNTIYFIDKINALSGSLEKCMFWIVHSSFHEARHSVQQQFDSYSYEGFFNDIDSFFIRRSAGRVDYNINHDRFFVEIDANRYGIKKARVFLRERYPSIYKRFEREFLMREKKYELDYISFDPVNEIDRAIKMFNTVDFPSKNRSVNLKRDLPVFDIFLNNNYKFKKVKDIIRDNRFYELDERIVASFFSSKSFLEQIDLSKLDYDELYAVNESLKMIENYYKNQEVNIASLDDGKDFIDKLRDKRSAIGKISYTKEYVKRLLYNNYGYVRNDREMEEHRKNVKGYLNKSKNVMNRKYGRGFLLIDICYFFGLFISIFVLIYLLKGR